MSDERPPYLQQFFLLGCFAAVVALPSYWDREASTRLLYVVVQRSIPLLQDVVLLGGGHPHVEVLRQFGMRPIPGVRFTLIAASILTPYSGMLPGYVAGYYSAEECHVDLAVLTTFAGARLVIATATGIDSQAQHVLLEGRPPIRYDVLSVNVGITPAATAVSGALEFATPVKPIARLIERFDRLLVRALHTGGRLRVAVVGGGAAGVELALALSRRLATEVAAGGGGHAAAEPLVTLYTRGRILSSKPSRAREAVLREAAAAGVEVREHVVVEKVKKGRLLLAGGSEPPFDECLWCTQAAPAAWVSSTGLPTDDSGFISIDETLRCAGGPSNVFAVGDVASSVTDPRPKAGVFAVRQGPVLADNLRRQLTGQPLQAFRPQQTFLSLITTGRCHAIACKGWLCFEADWLWSLKDWIDHKWMSMYGSKLLDMRMTAPSAKTAVAEQQAVAASAGAGAPDAVAAAAMRCAGCASKVGAGVLGRVLHRLRAQVHSGADVLVGLDAPDDAAVITAPPSGHVSVQTVDFFRSSVPDPYLFGRIVAEHALGDCYAMGAAPSTALAIAVVPFAAQAQMEEELFQMLAGAASVLSAAGCSLVGGHSCEGPDPALGFAVTGIAMQDQLLRKGGLQPGQALVLTKPLGTGVIFAANMRLRAEGAWVAGALESMQQSNAAGADCLRRHGASGCTDVTGFGLLGHLEEMARASQVSATLRMDAVAALPGAMDVLAAGIASSLAPQNAEVARAVCHAAEASQHPAWPLLMDPQTGGGLLAGVSAVSAAECIAELHSLGYDQAAVIGQTATGPTSIAVL